MAVEVKPVRFLAAGIGGYAWSIAQSMMALSESPNPDIKLVAMCDPAPELFPDRISLLQGKGIRTYRTYEEMIEKEDADAVWLPLPIHLHKPFAEQALKKGLHVVTEKPAAGTLQEVDAMIAARDQAGREVLVGFQDIYASPTLPAKRALLEGAIGTVQHATVFAAWPRDSKYFARNKWAGALAVNGQWVLDSPLQNAVSHYVNLALFLLGGELYSSADLASVEAELYRANKIENYDTCALRVKLVSGATLMVFFTHSCVELIDATVHLTGTEGTLAAEVTGVTLKGRREAFWDADKTKHATMMRAVARRVRGIANETPVATLEIARVHTALVNAVSEAAAIVPIDPAFIFQTPARDATLTAVTDIEKVLRRCAAERKLPSELGDIPWARPGGRTDLAGYNTFAGPK